MRSNRRQFIKTAIVTATALPFVPYIASTDDTLHTKLKQAFVIRDSRFPASVLFADNMGNMGYSVLDVNTDVSASYLQLKKLVNRGEVAVLTGVTMYTTKDIMSTLFATRTYHLSLDERAGNRNDSPLPELWAWCFEKKLMSV